MASNSIQGAGAPVTLPNAVPPMPAVARILARYDRLQLEAFLSVAIDLLDTMDGDPDAEDDDPSEEDSEDQGNDEGEPDMRSLHGDGPGCLISDPDLCQAGDDGCGPIVQHGVTTWGSEFQDADLEPWFTRPR